MGDFYASSGDSSALTFTAYSDTAMTSIIGTLTSSVASNLGTTQIQSLDFANVRALKIAGGPSGSSFTMDDLSFAPGISAPIPEPNSFVLFAAGALVVLGAASRGLAVQIR